MMPMVDPKTQFTEDFVSLEKIKEEIQQASQMLIRRDIELTKVNQELKKLNESKSDFISMAAHQLRTPLSIIQWYSEMLLSERHGSLNEKQHTYQQKIYNGAQLLSELVNTLLHISRLELNLKIHNKNRFSLQSVFDSVYESYELYINEKQEKVTFDVESIEVTSDPALFKILFQNLLSNALRYTPPNGNIAVRAWMTRATETLGVVVVEPDNIMISVTDTGYGIPEAEQERIFSKLFRGQTAFDKGIKGMGLGLYLVKLIITHLEGQVWFTSVPGKGTTFFICLPETLLADN